MKTFALIGAAGFIAPRHMQAIRDTNNQLVAALDKFDSVGILDSYFPDSDFFVEFERFDRHIDMLKRKGQPVDYISICSPNYLHDSHIRFGLRHQADVICEKPLVLTPWHLESLMELEKETGKKIWNILQLRYHPTIIDLKKEVEAAPEGHVFDIDLIYITSRGHWYYASWKGDEVKSGGIAANIGIHFFDMLLWVFGDVKESAVHVKSHDRASGTLQLAKAKVRWFLSINPDTLPEDLRQNGKRTFRSIKMEGKEIEFSDGFTDLHTVSYQHILEQNGFGLEEAQKSIELVHKIIFGKLDPINEECHPLSRLPLAPHPFLNK